jgi:hypothetical protein
MAGLGRIAGRVGSAPVSLEIGEERDCAGSSHWSRFADRGGMCSLERDTAQIVREHCPREYRTAKVRALGTTGSPIAARRRRSSSA